MQCEQCSRIMMRSRRTVLDDSGSLAITAWTLSRLLSLQHSRDPAKQARPDFAAVDFIENFVSSTR